MAKKTNNTKPTYGSLNHELEAVLVAMQRDDIDVDEAIKLYERGLELIKQLEAHLQAAENTINELQADFDK